MEPSLLVGVEANEAKTHSPVRPAPIIGPIGIGVVAYFRLHFEPFLGAVDLDLYANLDPFSDPIRPRDLDEDATRREISSHESLTALGSVQTHRKVLWRARVEPSIVAHESFIPDRSEDREAVNLPCSTR